MPWTNISCWPSRTWRGSGRAITRPLSTLRDAFAGLRKRWLLVLAVLLHDLGKAYRADHEQRGVDLAAGVLDRLGVAGEDRERILFLIGNHLVMSSLSQRRELNDHKVIADFARLVGTGRTLPCSICSPMPISPPLIPRAWTQWKAVLLQDLYLRTLNHLESKVQTAGELQARLTHAAARIRDAAIGAVRRPEIDRSWHPCPTPISCMPRRGGSSITWACCGGCLRKSLVIQYRHYPERGYTELTVCAYDAYGMFYRTAGTIASKNLNILRAQVYTSRRRVS